MFDKEEQRRRAAAFSAAQLAIGVQAPKPLAPIVISKPALTPKVKPRAKSNVLYEESYMNSIKQVLTPGCKIVMIASGYQHSVKVHAGNFIGVNYGNGRNNKPTSLALEVIGDKGERRKTSSTTFRVYAVV